MVGLILKKKLETAKRDFDILIPVPEEAHV